MGKNPDNLKIDENSDVSLTNTTLEEEEEEEEEEEKQLNTRTNFSKNIYLNGEVANKMGDEAINILLSAYPDAGNSRFIPIEIGIIKKVGKKSELGIRLFKDRDNRDFEPIKNKDGTFRKNMRTELKENLGPNADEAAKQVDEGWEKAKKDKELQQSILEDPESTEIQKDEARENLRKIEEEIERLQERENYLSKFKSISEKIKTIFKKYGLTVGSIVLSLSAIIFSIILNLTSGLKNALKKLGGGLKEISKKLANLLPGMIGAIANFIFKKAGEVFGFLAKNAWLLILAVVIYFIEEFKKKV